MTMAAAQVARTMGAGVPQEFFMVMEMMRHSPEFFQRTEEGLKSLHAGKGTPWKDIRANLHLK